MANNDPTPEEFDKIVDDVWARLVPMIPPDLNAMIGKLHIRIEDEPSPELLRDLEGEDLFDHPSELCGLYTGVPLTEESISAPALFPNTVYLFRKALLEEADYDGSPEAIRDLREEIAITLLHEIGHFFGLGEDDLERLGFD